MYILLSVGRESTAFRVPAGHARKTPVLIGHRLLAAARALVLGFGAVRDILLQCSFHTQLPGIDGFAVQVERFDERYDVGDRHAWRRTPEISLA